MIGWRGLRGRLDRRGRRRLLGPWLAVNIGYDVLHTVVMIGVFRRYGLDPWVYCASIAAFSVGFAWSSLALLGALVDGRGRRAWALSVMVAVCFFAPEFFLVTTTRHVPRYLYVLLGVYVTGSTAVAAVSLARRYRSRREPSAAVEEPRR